MESRGNPILAGPRSIRIEELPLSEIGPSQIRVRLRGCGLCGSNLPVWEGRPWFNYPLPAGAPGHEGWGQVEAVGAEVATLRPGDSVAMLSYHSFAEYDLAEAGQAIKLPSALAAEPFPGEPLACAVNVFRRSEITTGQTVAIVGLGFLGLLLTQLAARAGARVIAISRRPFAREMAQRMGAAEVLSGDNPAYVIETVKQLTDRAGSGRVIEATGFQGPLDLASELTAERGRLIIAGYHQDGPRQVNLQQWNWRGLDVINAHERDPAVYIQGMKEAVSLVEAGTLNPAPLYTHRFKLDRLNVAFEEMKAGESGFIKGLVIYD